MTHKLQEIRKAARELANAVDEYRFDVKRDKSRPYQDELEKILDDVAYNSNVLLGEILDAVVMELGPGALSETLK